MRRVKIIVENHADSYVAYLLAMRCPNRTGGPDFLTMPNHSTVKASTLRTILTHAGIARDDSLRTYEQS